MRLECLLLLDTLALALEGGKHLWLPPAGTECMHVDPRYLSEGFCTLLTGRLNDSEEGGIGIGQAQECVRPADCIDFPLGESNPTIRSQTEKPLTQTAIWEGHTISLSVRVLRG